MAKKRKSAKAPKRKAKTNAKAKAKTRAKPSRRKAAKRAAARKPTRKTARKRKPAEAEGLGARISHAVDAVLDTLVDAERLHAQTARKKGFQELE